jgi:hypothetical protein
MRTEQVDLYKLPELGVLIRPKVIARYQGINLYKNWDRELLIEIKKDLYGIGVSYKKLHYETGEFCYLKLEGGVVNNIFKFLKSMHEDPDALIIENWEKAEKVIEIIQLNKIDINFNYSTRNKNLNSVLSFPNVYRKSDEADRMRFYFSMKMLRYLTKLVDEKEKRKSLKSIIKELLNGSFEFSKNGACIFLDGKPFDYDQYLKNGGFVDEKNL